MSRLCVLLAALSLSVAAHADLKADFQKQYTLLDTALAKKDSAAVSKWCAANLTADFTYTSRDGNLYKRDPFAKGLQDQIRLTQKVESSNIKVVSVSVKGNVATVTVDSNTTAKIVFDSKLLKLVDKSHDVDTWTRVGKTWKQKRSVQKSGDTQMYPT